MKKMSESRLFTRIKFEDSHGLVVTRVIPSEDKDKIRKISKASAARGYPAVKETVNAKGEVVATPQPFKRPPPKEVVGAKEEKKEEVVEEAK